jgi:hypothetical protein
VAASQKAKQSKMKEDRQRKILVRQCIGLFGVLTGYLATAFLKPKSAQQSEQEAVHTTPDTLQAGLQELRRLVLVQEQYTAELKKRLEMIDGLLQEHIE